MGLKLVMLSSRIALENAIKQQRLLFNIRKCSSSQSTNEEKEKELERIVKDASIDEPPTSCCQSGCANCVFIVWAEALSEKMQHAGPEISDKIFSMVDDPSLKAYLEMELRMRGLKK